MPTTVEYIWLDASGSFRSKCRVLSKVDVEELTLKKIPDWNFDGSSTQQAEGHKSEVIIKPRCLFQDPFRQYCDGKAVICDTYDVEGNPLKSNHRFWADSIFNQHLKESPWYGLEQEYFLIDPSTGLPLGFPPSEDDPPPQGKYYCGVGHGKAFGREVIEEHLRVCLLAGVKISGVNGEVAPGQWEFQVGPCCGIECGDHMSMARYLLERVAENHGLTVNLEPKPILGDWNGSGCHVNYSTLSMREGREEKTGLSFIEEAIDRLREQHSEHMKIYGENNQLRLTGKHETAKYSEFTSGWANRGASVRIGSDTIREKQGYFEDRRPASNIDPYLVSAKIFKTTVLNDPVQYPRTNIK